MKRLITCLFGFALLCFSGFGTEFKNGISNGGFCVFEADYGQGNGEWSFPILTTDNGLMLRDNVTVGGFGKASGTHQLSIAGCSLGDNFLFGKMYDSDCFRVKVYTFAGAELSLFSCQNHPLFSPSVMLGAQFGGGFEFQYSAKNSFVTEFGGKSRYVLGKDTEEFSEYNSTSPIIKLGFRSYY